VFFLKKVQELIKSAQFAQTPSSLHWFFDFLKLSKAKFQILCATSILSNYRPNSCIECYETNGTVENGHVFGLLLECFVEGPSSYIKLSNFLVSKVFIKPYK